MSGFGSSRHDLRVKKVSGLGMNCPSSLVQREDFRHRAMPANTSSIAVGLISFHASRAKSS